VAQTNIQHKLSTAVATLLGCSSSLLSTSAHPHVDKIGDPWIINLGLANYIERDRNTGVELIIDARHTIDEDSLSIKFELDVITGATPNGATASNVPQTFTMSSGNGDYRVSANELPADDTHMDTRLGLSSTYSKRFNSNLLIDYQSFISMEFDYLAFGAGADITHDFNQHNTSVLFGINFEYNRVHPVGNIPTAFGIMQPAGQQQPRGKAGTSRRVAGLSMGLNQVLSKQSLLQLKYSYAEASGYLTDPYKILSLIENPSGRTLDFLFENRPDERKIQSLYTAYKLYLAGNILDLSYRYYWDEWEIKSSTFDVRYRKKLSNNNFIQPHIRYYTQTEADFFTHSLADNKPLPKFSSADFRLAKFDAYTLGFKYGEKSDENKEYSISVEYYIQQGESHPTNGIGLQKQQDLFPTLHTLVLFYNYAFEW